MRTVIATLLSAALLVVVGGGAFVYSGAFNVAANDPHWSVTTWILDNARIRSIKAHAAGIAAPPGYDEQAKVVGAVGHYAEHCAVCHGGPGVKRGAIAEGMYPQPPDLTNVAHKYAAGELFWILQNGIKMSAMPSMADDGPEMLWATVAFLQKLPGLSEEDYNDLWMQAQSGGGHGGMDHGSMNMGSMNHGSMDHGAMHAPAPQPAASEGAAQPAGSTADSGAPRPTAR